MQRFDSGTAGYSSVSFSFCVGKEQDLIGNDLGDVFRHSVLVFIAPVDNPSFNRHLASFFKKSGRSVGKTVPCHNVVPGSFLHFLTFAILVIIVGCKREMCNLFTSIQGFCFRILTKISDQM